MIPMQGIYTEDFLLSDMALVTTVELLNIVYVRNV